MDLLSRARRGMSLEVSLAAKQSSRFEETTKRRTIEAGNARIGILVRATYP